MRIRASIRAAEKKETARLDKLAITQAAATVSWHLIGDVTGAGGSTTLQAHGKVKIECADALAGMHLNSCDFYGTLTNIDDQGNSEAGVYPNYQGTLASGGFNVAKGSKTFDAENGAKDWTFKINGGHAVSDNAGIPQLRIYEWK
jgi:hypothetical protein